MDHLDKETMRKLGVILGKPGDGMTIQLVPLLERMAREENFDVMGDFTGYFHKLNNLKMAADLTAPLPMSFSALLAARFHHQEQRTEKEDSSVNTTTHPRLAGDAK